MAIAASVLALATDGKGYASADFLSTTPDEWAERHMRSRYGQTLSAEELERNPAAKRSYELLKEERKALGGWFDENGKLQLLLQSAFLTNRLHGPIGDGFGWDFRSNGEPEPRMLMFKGILIAATRTAHLIPPANRNRGSMQFGGLATLIRSAFTERAMIHAWRGTDTIKADEMSRRWVATQTFAFLVRLDAETDWAWQASHSGKVLGPVDDLPKVF